MAGEDVKVDAQIVRQVEYYFGDANLRKDRFMKQTLDENDGWMPMETLLKFNRLKNLSADPAVIAAALRKSENGLVDVDEEGTKLRRSLSRPLPEWSDTIKKDTNQRTVYIKGFPTTAKLDDVEAFLVAEGYDKGPVVNIVMRRMLDSRDFKGSVFVEFCDVETVEKFIDAKHSLPDSEEPLLVYTRNEYYKKKEGERKELKGKVRESALAAARELQEEAEDDEIKFEPGCVLCFDKCGEETTRESLKELFGKFSDIQWVNFTKGDTCGKIRFLNSGGAAKALEGVQGESEDKVVKIDGAEATCTVLEGDAEVEYYKEVRREVAAAKAKSRGGRQHRGGFGGGRGRGGGRGGGRGRGRGFKRYGSRGDEPRAKRSRDD